jgi:Uma2 family endonuclease
MATMPDMPAPTFTGFTQAELERLEDEHPELGRLEVIDGALHATGGSAVGNLHQLLLQRLHLLLVPLCPPQHVLRLDTWWFLARGTLRPDVAVYRLWPCSEVTPFRRTPGCLSSVGAAARR